MMDPERRFREALLATLVFLPLVLLWMAGRWVGRWLGWLPPPPADDED